MGEPLNKPLKGEFREMIEDLGDSDGANGGAGELVTIHFYENSAKLAPSQKKILRHNVDYLKKNPQLNFQILGHDNSSKGNSDFKFTQSRAMLNHPKM